ncbi:MAG: hypothetical protein WA609_05220 [Terriglobales bacterium]
MVTMMLLISIVLGIVPWLGIAWTVETGTIKTQDGLFMSLILLTLSGVFFLNAFWELRDKGALAFLHKKKNAAPATAKTAAPAAAKAAAPATASKAIPTAASESKEA